MAGLGINSQPDTQAHFYDAIFTPYRHTLYGHTDRVSSAIFSADGNMILTASWDNTAKLWDIKGNEIASLEHHTGNVSSAVFNANGDMILTTSHYYGDAKLWDMQGNEILTLGDVTSAVLNPDGDIILTAHGLDFGQRLSFQHHYC